MTWCYVYSIIVTALAIWFAVWGALNAHQYLRMLNGLCKLEPERWLEVREVLRKVSAKPTHARLLAMMKRCGMLE